MSKYEVTGQDIRGKYPTKSYVVEAETKFDAEISVIDRYIADVGHPAIKPGRSARSYYSRFYFSTKAV